MQELWQQRKSRLQQLQQAWGGGGQKRKCCGTRGGGSRVSGEEEEEMLMAVTVGHPSLCLYELGKQLVHLCLDHSYSGHMTR